MLKHTDILTLNHVSHLRWNHACILCPAILRGLIRQHGRVALLCLSTCRATELLGLNWHFDKHLPLYVGHYLRCLRNYYILFRIKVCNAQRRLWRCGSYWHPLDYAFGRQRPGGCFWVCVDGLLSTVRAWNMTWVVLSECPSWGGAYVGFYGSPKRGVFIVGTSRW